MGAAESAPIQTAETAGVRAHRPARRYNRPKAMPNPVGDVTGLLKRWSSGDEAALDELLPIVYDELRRLAGHYLRLEAPGPMLQATALVHEAYLRLVKDTDREWAGRTHFFAVSSRIIRHLLVDHARETRAAKRGGGAERLPIDAADGVAAPDDLDLVELDEALDALAALDPMKSRIVELRFFGGLSVAETAAVLGIAPATVKRHFAVAKLWLHRRLRGDTVGARPA
jgi:RNA polymerase sigma factor (TIGR02999 family)